VGPSGRELISFQKVDSLLVFLNIMGAKEVSVNPHVLMAVKKVG
jgi:hypothetical protein